MGVARIQFGRRPTKEVVGRTANRRSHPIAIAAFLLALMGAAAPAHNDSAAIRAAAAGMPDSRASESSSEAAATWAGFGGVTITEMLSQRLELPSAGGVIVTFVHPEGPATDAGLLPKDIILRANGEPIVDGAAWSEWVAEQLPGTRVELSVRRQNEVISLPLTLEELPANVEPDKL